LEIQKIAVSVFQKIDIAIAAYIMTSEREEYIDFVSPYYEQSGLLISMCSEKLIG
jgi:ABC-type amino acid transport substrate-binding protein